MLLKNRRAFPRVTLLRGNAVRVDASIALVRTLIASTAFLAVHVNPGDQPLGALATLVVPGYATMAACILLVVAMLGRVPRGLPVLSHCADVCVMAALVAGSSAPDSPVFLVAVYTLLAAAYRWGFIATISTAAASGLLLGAQTLVTEYVQLGSVDAVQSRLAWNHLIVWTGYLAIASLLVGYLSEQGMQRRRVASTVDAMTEGSSAATSQILKALLRPALGAFKGTQALVVTHEPMLDRCLLWHVSYVNGSERVIVNSSPLDAARLAEYLGGQNHDTWHAKRRRGHGCDVRAIDCQGRRCSAAGIVIPQGVLSQGESHDVLSIPVEIKGRLTGRIFLQDPQVGFDRFTELRIAQRLAGDIGYAAHHAARMRRTRERAGTLERARIARELHDSVVQALCATELQMDVIRREVENAAPAQAAALSQIQQSVTRQVRSLRLLTRRMQRAWTDRPFPDDLAEIVRRFEKETGIAARLAAGTGPSASPRVRRELVRIVHEGLQNVRKHSGARHVSVSTKVVGDQWEVSIEDDGCGFPFSGRLSQSELDAVDQGPFVIKQRIRGLRGKMSVESTPGRGARVLFQVPMRS
jgi:signal transduction histidine kinase